MLIKCDKTKPRFHAFLKLCQSKPECGRQSLQDLLIRPVQRLPSINLLLNGRNINFDIRVLVITDFVFNFNYHHYHLFFRYVKEYI